MNASTPIDTTTARAVATFQPCLFTQAAHVLHAASVALIASAQAGGKLGAELIATGNQLFEEQRSTVSALAQIKSPQEALDMQWRFATHVWAAYAANATALSAAVQQVWKPFGEAPSPANASV